MTPDRDAALRAWATAIQKLQTDTPFTPSERDALTQFGAASLLRPSARLHRKVQTKLLHTPPVKIRVKP